MERLWMTQPYFAVPNSYFVAEDSPYQAAERPRREGDRCVRELLARAVPARGARDPRGRDRADRRGPGDRHVTTRRRRVCEAVAKGKIDAFLCG